MDSQENLVVASKVFTKGKDNSDEKVTDKQSRDIPEGLVKKRERKSRDIEKINQGFDDLSKFDIGPTDIKTKQRESKAKDASKPFVFDDGDQLDNMELRASSREKGKRNGDKEKDKKKFDEEDPQGNTYDREHKKASGKNLRNGNEGQQDSSGIKDLNTVGKRFGAIGGIVANNLLDPEQDAWNTGRVVDRDPKRKKNDEDLTKEDIQKNYNTVDMRTKKATRNDSRDPWEAEEANVNSLGTVGANL